jgi:hypothetical protein
MNLGGKDVKYVHAKSASSPETKETKETKEKPEKEKVRKKFRIDDETTEVPIIHGVNGDHLVPML